MGSMPSCLRTSPAASAGSRLIAPRISHGPMQRPRVLHGDERVALEDEAGDAHQHREDVVIERLGRIAEEPAPDLGARSEAKGTRRIELRREHGLHQSAALEAQHTPIVAAAH